MKKRVVDANAFLRFFLDDIPEQKVAAKEVFKEAKKGESTLYIPQIVLFEIEFTLDKYYGFSKTERIDKLKVITAMPYLQIQDRDIFKKALQVFETNNISFADSFQLMYAAEKNAKLFTFDQKLLKLVSS